MVEPSAERVMVVAKPGWLTTVQDGGRRGYQRYGVPVGGAMDAFALRLANALVGNAPDAAALELTLASAAFPGLSRESRSPCPSRQRAARTRVRLSFRRRIDSSKKVL